MQAIVHGHHLARHCGGFVGDEQRQRCHFRRLRYAAEHGSFGLYALHVRMLLGRQHATRQTASDKTGRHGVHAHRWCHGARQRKREGVERPFRRRIRHRRAAPQQPANRRHQHHAALAAGMQRRPQRAHHAPGADRVHVVGAVKFSGVQRVEIVVRDEARGGRAVHQRINAAMARQRGLRKGGTTGVVPHVQRVRAGLHAVRGAFLRQRNGQRCLLVAKGAQCHVPALRRKRAGARRANAGGGAGDAAHARAERHAAPRAEWRHTTLNTSFFIAACAVRTSARRHFFSRISSSTGLAPPCRRGRS